MSLQHLLPFRLLSNSLRAAAQRHGGLPFTISATRSIQSDAAADAMDMMGLGEILRSEAQKKTGSALSEYADPDAFSAVPQPKMAVRRFQAGRGGASFLQPHNLRFEGVQSKRKRFPKPYAVGPDRADAERSDIFYQLEMDPLAECMNSSLLSNFVTEMGRVKSRAETHLTWRNQRRLGKAIRRAKKMGIIPFFSKRPLDFRYSLLYDGLGRSNPA